MNNGYEWTKNTTELLAEVIPATRLPHRAAITAIGAVTAKRAGATALLLCNPHASSWNNWLLPYGSIAAAVSPAELGNPETFGTLAERLDMMLKSRLSEYSEKALGGIGEMLGWSNLQFEKNAFFTSYSLKFSKSANLWTTYVFGYHKCISAAVAVPVVPSTWLLLTRTVIDKVAKTCQYNGLPLAGNVITLITDPAACKLLGMGS